MRSGLLGDNINATLGKRAINRVTFDPKTLLTVQRSNDAACGNWNLLASDRKILADGHASRVRLCPAIGTQEQKIGSRKQTLNPWRSYIADRAWASCGGDNIPAVRGVRIAGHLRVWGRLYSGCKSGGNGTPACFVGRRVVLFRRRERTSRPA